jgi:hypothetical protein
MAEITNLAFPTYEDAQRALADLDIELGFIKTYATLQEALAQTGDKDVKR